ncbi:MAG: tRNA pseudouridine(55) synthase TruB [Aureliella sp.]
MFGVLPVDKPSGWTSRDVVNRVQRYVRPHKVGHTGTLDPLATGVLLVAVGPATRLVEFSHLSPKSYAGSFQLGRRSDTLDIEGELEDVPVPDGVNERSLALALPRFIGEVEQVPPKYSAVSVGGQRAYDLARKGKDFEIPSRKVQIDSIHLARCELPDFKLDIVCGTGTYIRTLGSDLAKAVGTDAVMTSLIRSSIGSVTLELCSQLDDFQSGEDVAERLLPPSILLESLPSVQLDQQAAAKIRNGIPLKQSELMKRGSVEYAPSNAPVQGAQNAAASPLAAFDQAGFLVAILCDTSTNHSRSGRVYRSLRVFQPEASQSAPAANHPQNTSNPQSPES